MSGRLLCKSENYVYTISIHEPPPFEASLTLTSLLTFSTGGACHPKKEYLLYETDMGNRSAWTQNQTSNIKRVKLSFNNDQPCVKHYVKYSKEDQGT